MTHFALLGGKSIPLTEEEEKVLQARAKLFDDNKVERAMDILRTDRIKLLNASDWTGLSDSALINEKSAEWRLYRQKLRDITSGLDTVEKVNAVTWPTKPE